ncbi:MULTISPECIES: phosphoglycerate dehydrogenase [Trueperella]|uniref:2-oxoglutarate reductase n=1 Tax=Trueperella bernardiae TaxID=59561 RepID=A0A0W1KLJ2_9ACTO|nr:MULTISPECIES: phosphoglycerate dehydrogenase [Trueperella]KTF04804.1 D-3-phosphoglycerate dehydrogenase [Trueperella bernardiae]MCM3907282.1 phosphoglycerate dehydrogenase [Trueperella bernardiae]OFS65802.1 D-3-phosphoglycerate dehydrogenase [Trueperella sp. HMSC08H06]OFS75766.1 D-3-phosphoglycerate dehydrogenase [Trueperella sp. HMSC08B05]PKZ89794.1 phosphoglycerate dehydrogenase [Trueperella bernardiae]
MARVLLLENPHEVANEVFGQYGIEVERVPGSLDTDELIARLQGFDMVGIRSKTNITRDVIEACPQLTAIGAYCIGTNQIDLEAASDHGVAVFNAPYSNTRSVVEMAIGELIALVRRIPQKNAALHKGVWQKTAEGAHEVRGKTLGIIGYGSIGSQLSVVAEALGMKVIFHDIAERLALGNATRVSLDELLATADVVSLHIDGRPANTGYFDAEMFAKLKHGVILLNLARGHVMDLDALREALLSGQVAGAAVDVFPSEPLKNGDPFSSVLIGFDNVILTPHIGGSTLEAQESIGSFVSAKLLNYWRKGSTELSVNTPNIATAPAAESLHRVAWYHWNTPGALADVNRLFADEGVNVTFQSLATQGEYGYMVTDTAAEVPEVILERLQEAKAHIRLRLLTRE